MPIRGRRNPRPKQGGKPQNIFGSPQKKPSTDMYSGDLVRYAKSGGGEIAGKPKGSNSKLRHQSPRRNK